MCFIWTVWTAGHFLWAVLGKRQLWTVWANEHRLIVLHVSKSVTEGKKPHQKEMDKSPSKFVAECNLHAFTKSPSKFVAECNLHAFSTWNCMWCTACPVWGLKGCFLCLRLHRMHSVSCVRLHLMPACVGFKTKRLFSLFEIASDAQCACVGFKRLFSLFEIASDAQCVRLGF